MRLRTTLLYAALVAIGLGPWLLRPGTFLDGMTYASIARNMSAGIGTFWQPHYTSTVYPIFYEHPPLGLGIEYLFFSALGDGFYTEKIYGLVLTIGLLIALRYIMSGVRLHAGILLLLSPLALWMSSNVLLELPLALAAILSILSLDRALDLHRSPRTSPLYMVAAVALSLAAIYIKGPVALFLLVAPSLIAWYHRRSMTSILIAGLAHLLLLTSSFLVIMAALPEASAYWVNYLDQQVLSSIAGEREKSSALTWIGVTAFNWCIPLGLSLVAAWWYHTRHRPRNVDGTKDIHQLTMEVPLSRSIQSHANKLKSTDPRLLHKPSRQATAFLLLALAATLPLLISPKIHMHYSYPGLILWMVALSHYFSDSWKAVVSHVLSHRWYVQIAVGIILIGLSLMLLRSGDSRKNDHRIDYAISAADDLEDRTLCAADALLSDWMLHACLQRYARASLRYAPPCEGELIRDKLEGYKIRD